MRPDWESIKLDVMRHVLELKFAPETRWRQLLIQTGEQPIVEYNNWHDGYWGFCICSRCQPKEQHNHLGVLLMTLRAEYAATERGGAAGAWEPEPDGAGDAGAGTAPAGTLHDPLANVQPISQAVLLHLKRDQQAARAATQFIGYPARVGPSMTERYRQAWDAIGRANTGVYGPDDLIIVSGSGPWGNTTLEQIAQVFEEQVVPLLEKGIAARSRFIVGYASGNDQLVRDYLLSRGYQAEGELAGHAIYSPPAQLKPAPEQIEQLEAGQVFVFGTNTEGRHGKGAALTAFGAYPRCKGAVGRWAVYGQARGLMRGHEGLSYGIKTIDLRQGRRSVPLSEIEQQITELIAFAREHPHLEFLVTAFGTALAGYSIEEIGRLWQGKTIPPNVRLPQCWIELL